MGEKKTWTPRRAAGRLAAVAIVSGIALAGCSNVGEVTGGFLESVMGVSASPRVTNSANVPRGGGRYQIGQPYQVAGRWYEPRHQPDLDVTGQASWYGAEFHGRLTANGEIFDRNHLSGAHPTLPLPSYVRVTNMENGASTLVRINDRGPFAHNRVIDLSQRVAGVLGFINDGVADVRVEYVGPAPLEGDDTSFLVASINTPTVLEDPSVMVAYADTTSPVSPAAASLDAIGALIGETGAVSTMAYAPSEPVTVGFDIFAAHEAAADATEVAALDGWRSTLDIEAREVNLALGTFVDAPMADEIALRFALIGAVEVAPAVLAGHEAWQVRLSHLRPGVTHADVSNLAEELGLRAPSF